MNQPPSTGTPMYGLQPHGGHGIGHAFNIPFSLRLLTVNSMLVTGHCDGYMNAMCPLPSRSCIFVRDTLGTFDYDCPCRAGAHPARPRDLHKRGGKKCTCTEAAASQQTKAASGNVVVYSDTGVVVKGGDSSSSSSSSSSSWSSNGNSGSSSSGNPWSESDSTYVDTVIYVDYVPYEVPVTTTCMTTGTIVIENNITINVTVAPTVAARNPLLTTGNHLYQNRNIHRNANDHCPGLDLPICIS
jgi:hypothetical protein